VFPALQASGGGDAVSALLDRVLVGCEHVIPWTWAARCNWVAARNSISS